MGIKLWALPFICMWFVRSLGLLILWLASLSVLWPISRPPISTYCGSDIQALSPRFVKTVSEPEIQIVNSVLTVRSPFFPLLAPRKPQPYPSPFHPVLSLPRCSISPLFSLSPLAVPCVGITFSSDLLPPFHSHSFLPPSCRHASKGTPCIRADPLIFAGRGLGLCVCRCLPLSDTPQLTPCVGSIPRRVACHRGRRCADSEPG